MASPRGTASCGRHSAARSRWWPRSASCASDRSSCRSTRRSPGASSATWWATSSRGWPSSTSPGRGPSGWSRASPSSRTGGEACRQSARRSRRRPWGRHPRPHSTGSGAATSRWSSTRRARPVAPRARCSPTPTSPPGCPRSSRPGTGRLRTASPSRCPSSTCTAWSRGSSAPSRRAARWWCFPASIPGRSSPARSGTAPPCSSGCPPCTTDWWRPRGSSAWGPCASASRAPRRSRRTCGRRCAAGRGWPCSSATG